MKNLKTFAIFLLAAAVLSSCGGLNKMVKNADQVSYQVTPEVLEMHGGTVDVTVDVNYPAKYFNKKAVVTLTPVLKFEEGEGELDPLMVQGEDVTENNKVIGYDNGGSASVSRHFEYQDQMMRSELYVRATGAIKSKTAELGEVKIADGIIVTPLLVHKDAKVITFSDNYQQIVPESYQTDIKYIINRADVRKSETSKEGVVELNDVLVNTNSNDRLELKGLEISAYASPDGDYDFNARLSEQRKNTADRYLQGQLKKNEIEIADELMTLLSTPEDWDGFKTLMEESDIQDKEMILRVLSMHSDPVVREQEIRNLSAAFEEIAEKILPELRRSKFIVSMEHIGWSDAELKDLWNSNRDTLVLEELLYTATLFDDLDTKAAIYKKATEVSPQCVRAHNNLGAMLYEQGKMAQAEASFKQAKSIRDHDIINNNLGAIALQKGEVATAKELFTASLGAGEKVNYNLGIVNIIEGNYEAAVNYFGSQPSFDAALAKYLNKDTNGAWRTASGLDASPDVHYLLAVIAASQDNTNAALDNLEQAIETCQEPQMMKDRASKDLEFAKLFNEDRFKSIVQ
ncbi:MAG: tetratricopeptide repeat protein [Bacteroidales bacterium]